MKIWVDADACPLTVKSILHRTAIRHCIPVIFVSNQILTIPNSPYIKKMKVSQGFDVADNEIIKMMEGGDLIITADIPLAHAVVEKGGTALNPRGILYTENNIKQKLSIRNFNEQLRDSGVQLRGPSKLTKKEIQNFANFLDRILTARRVDKR